MVREALRFYESHRTDPQPVIYALWTLQVVLDSEKRYDEAAAVAQQGLDLAAERQRTDSPEVASILSNLANIRRGQEKYSEAEQLARQSVDLHRRVHGPQHPETGFAFRALGVALKSQGKFAEAKPAYEEALSIFRLQYGPHNYQHSAIANCIRDLKRVLESLGDKSALETLAKDEAEQATRMDSPDNHVRLAGLLLANTQPSDAQKEEAHRFVRWAIEGYRLAANDMDSLDQRLTAVGNYLEVPRICACAPALMANSTK